MGIEELNKFFVCLLPISMLVLLFVSFFYFMFAEDICGNHRDLTFSNIVFFQTSEYDFEVECKDGRIIKQERNCLQYSNINTTYCIKYSEWRLLQ